jgi:hypothetical protein
MPVPAYRVCSSVSLTTGGYAIGALEGLLSVALLSVGILWRLEGGVGLGGAGICFTAVGLIGLATEDPRCLRVFALWLVAATGLRPIWIGLAMLPALCAEAQVAWLRQEARRMIGSTRYQSPCATREAIWASSLGMAMAVVTLYAAYILWSLARNLECGLLVRLRDTKEREVVLVPDAAGTFRTRLQLHTAAQEQQRIAQEATQRLDQA